jgi:hypothetical protein
MRRGLEIREVFRPTRLSSEHLRAAYETATPMIERPVIRRGDAPVREAERVGDARAQAQRGAR